MRKQFKDRPRKLHHFAIRAFQVLHHLLLQCKQLLQLFLRQLKDRLSCILLQFQLNGWGGVAMHRLCGTLYNAWCFAWRYALM